MRKKFYVTVNGGSVSYPIEAENEEEAIYRAWDWFNERVPEFEVEEVEKFDDEIE